MRILVPGLNATYTLKLDGNLTVNSLELIAILVTLRWANRNKLETIVIQTPCINSGKGQILREISIIISKKVDRNIDWCQSHCNVAGNEMADKAAKQAMDNGTVYSQRSLPHHKKVK